MKFTTLSRRTAAAGAASALVAGALVGATTTAAQAAPIQNTYTCTTPVGPQEVVLDSDAPGIEAIPSLPAGLTVPPQSLSVTNTFTISDSFHNTLASFGVENLAIPGFAGTLGSSNVPVDGVAVTVSGMTQNEDGSWSTDSTDTDGDAVEGTGVNASFDLPAAGTYPVLSPESFTIETTLGGNPLSVPCTINTGTEPGSYDSLTMVKNDSVTKATAVNSPVKKGDVAKVKVKVTAPNETPGGKVVLKKGSKTLDSGTLNNKGVVTLKFKAKSVGANKLKAVYKGDGYTNKSNDAVTVKVKG